MIMILNLYLDPELSYLWHNAFVIAAKASGRGLNYAQNLCTWLRGYLHRKKLSLHHYGRYHSSILEDEDFAQDIQLHLIEIAKNGYIQ